MASRPVTMRAAIEVLRRRGPARIVVAVPVASPQVCAAFRPLVDDMICLLQPPLFYAIGLWYVDFSQTSDSEVRMLLDATSSLAVNQSVRSATTGTPTDVVSARSDGAEPAGLSPASCLA
jgi:predicted phosphoribosyltransferase